MRTSEAVVVIDRRAGGGESVSVCVDGKIVRGRCITLGDEVGGFCVDLDEPSVEVCTISGMRARRAVEVTDLAAGWGYTEEPGVLLAIAEAEIDE